MYPTASQTGPPGLCSLKKRSKPCPAAVAAAQEGLLKYITRLRLLCTGLPSFAQQKTDQLRPDARHAEYCRGPLKCLHLTTPCQHQQCDAHHKQHKNKAVTAAMQRTASAKHCSSLWQYSSPPIPASQPQQDRKSRCISSPRYKGANSAPMLSNAAMPRVLLSNCIPASTASAALLSACLQWAHCRSAAVPDGRLNDPAAP